MWISSCPGSGAEKNGPGGEPRKATCAKKRTCSPTGRASILKNGLVSHEVPSLKESCLIWWMTVRQSWRPAMGRSCANRQQSEGEAVPHGFTESHQLAGAGRAVGSHLDLRPLAGRDPTRLRCHRHCARAFALADVVPGLQRRLVRASDPVALLHGNAADRLAYGILDNADPQRLQLAVELTRDPPLPSNSDGAAGSYEKSSVKTGCGVRCSAAADGENATARKSSVARLRLALPWDATPMKPLNCPLALVSVRAGGGKSAVSARRA